MTRAHWTSISSRERAISGEYVGRVEDQQSISFIRRGRRSGGRFGAGLWAEEVFCAASGLTISEMELREKKVKERTHLALKGLHESTTMALFHHLATMACENNVQAMDRKNNAFQR